MYLFTFRLHSSVRAARERSGGGLHERDNLAEDSRNLDMHFAAERV